MKVNWDLMWAIFFAIILFCCLIWTFDYLKPNPYYKIIKGKFSEEITRAFSDTKYVITYEDGTYSYVTFGKYNTLEKGDTIWFNNYGEEEHDNIQ